MARGGKTGAGVGKRGGEDGLDCASSLSRELKLPNDNRYRASFCEGKEGSELRSSLG